MKIFLIAISLFFVLFTRINCQNITTSNKNRHYPNDSFSQDSIKSGVFVLYFLGIFFVMLTANQIYKIYLIPALKIIKNHNIFKEENYDSFIEPFAQSAFEIFICVFTCSLGNTDIGISAAIGVCAFSALFDKGIYMYIAANGNCAKFNLFIFIRDISLISFVLLSSSLTLVVDEINTWNSTTIFVISITIFILMQFTKSFEAWFTDRYCNKNQLKSLMRLDESEILKLHQVKNNELTYSPRSLFSEVYTLDDNGYLTYDFEGHERKVRVRLYDSAKESFAKLNSCVNKIICGRLCKILKQRIQRHIYSESLVKKDSECDKMISPLELSQNHATENSPRNSIKNGLQTPEDNKNPRIDLSPRGSDATKVKNLQGTNPLSLSDTCRAGPTPTIRGMKETIDLAKFESRKLGDSSQEESEDEKTIKKLSVTWPKDADILTKIWFIIMLPINMVLYFTIPESPNIEENNNGNNGKCNCSLAFCYLMSMIWLLLCAFLVSWWFNSLSESFEISHAILPFFIIQIGYVFRNYSEWVTFRAKILRLKRINTEFNPETDEALEQNIRQLTRTRQEIKQELISEKYMNFTLLFTFGMVITWIIYIASHENIQFITGRIWLKMLILSLMIILKGGSVIKADFETPSWLAAVHFGLYFVYISLFLLFEYA